MPLKKKIIIENLKDFSLAETLDCGQCFRWNRVSNSLEKNTDEVVYEGLIGSTALKASHNEREGKLTIYEEGDAFGEEDIRNYFDLNRDYGAIKKRLIKKDAKMKEVISFGKGIRILRQEPWEIMISFIISQNNHIPRIKKNIEGLCCSFGNKISGANGREYYTFPDPAALSGIKSEDLAHLKLGYRDLYIIRAVEKIKEEGEETLLSMKDTSYEEALSYLMDFRGIGRKVADCILLFGLDKSSAFPIDVWIKRAMNLLYGIDEKNEKAMKERAHDLYGEDAGFAQQYLYNYIMK